MQEHFTVQMHEAMMKEYLELVQAPLREDPNRSFRMEEFEASLGLGDTAPENSLLGFVQRRISYIQNEG